MVDYISFSSFFYRINIFLSPRRSGVWFFILNIYFPRQYDITLYFPGGCFSINIEHFQVMNKYFLTKFKFHLGLRVSPHLTSVLVLEKKNNIYYFHFLSSIVFNKNPKTIGPRNKWKCVLYKTPMSLHNFHHWYWLVECCKPFLKLTKIQCNLGEIFTASYKIYSIHLFFTAEVRSEKWEAGVAVWSKSDWWHGVTSVGQQAGSNWAVIKCVGSAALPSTSIIIWPLVITTLFPNWAQMDSQPPTLAPMFYLPPIGGHLVENQGRRPLQKWVLKWWLT